MLAGRGEQLLAALQNHGNPAVCKTCHVPAETIETCTILPGGKNFADKTTPVLGSVFGHQNRGQVARTQANQIETE